MKLFDISVCALIVAFYFGLVFSSLMRLDNVKNKHSCNLKNTVSVVEIKKGKNAG